MKKQEKYYTEDQKEILRFIKILVGLTIIVVLFYIGTRLFVTKDFFGKNYERTIAAGKIDYDEVIVGNMLNKNDKEYYVIAYSDKDIYANYYNLLVNTYTQLDNSLKVYRINSDSFLNQKYITKTASNPNAKTIDELQIKDIALIKVKNGKIVKYFETNEAIKSELS